MKPKSRRISASSPRTSGARNRKLQVEPARMPGPLTLLAALLFVVGLMFLWFSSRAEALSAQIKIEEQQLEDLRRQVAGEERRWSDLIGPRRLREALQAHRLNMDWPRPEQVIHIRDLALWRANAGELQALTRTERPELGSRLQ
jgi:hypothetical protein